MGRRTEGPEVVYVEHGGDASVKWLFWGAVLGAGLALLYAPRTGEETRRVLQRKLWKLRAETEEKLDELAQQFGSGKHTLEDLGGEERDEGDEGDEGDDAGDLPPLRPRVSGASARDELERRLAESRARRRAVGDHEEPFA
jgi:YtxH-like protein